MPRVELGYTPGQDTIRPIWEEIYIIDAPAIYVTPQKTIKSRGIPITGIEGIDKSIPTNMNTIGATINAMVEIYQKGGVISIKSDDDVLSIYNAIQNHLQYWIYYSRNFQSVHSTQIPIDDLTIMDEFARKIYPYANSIFINEIREGGKPDNDVNLLAIDPDKKDPIKEDSVEYDENNPLLDLPQDVNEVKYNDYDLPINGSWQSPLDEYIRR